MSGRIEKLRAEIDTIDGKLVELLCERFKIVNRIAEAKKELQVEIEDDARERDVKEHCKEVAGDRLDEGFIEELTRVILSYSKKIQQMRRER
ncbi:MAG: chorismate mutase [Candidatus Hydrothermarchaeales archaeon]